MRYVIEYSPSCDMFTSCLYEMVINSMEGQRHGLQIDKYTHYNVNSVYFMSACLQNKRPEACTQEEYK